MDHIEVDDDTRTSRYSLVNFVPSDSENEDEPAFEILLLPEKPSISLTHLSPSSPTSASPANFLEDSSDLYEFQRNSKYHGPSIANLSQTQSRIALSSIQDFVETTIVLRKDNNELGISVTGGSDTYLESICVAEVFGSSAAYKDGRMRKGDLILAVNDVSFRDICYRDAVRVLREAGSPLKLLVLRENPQILFTTSQKATKFITVTLRKSSIKDKLGLSFIQRTNGRGVFITFVQAGSIASQKGRVMQGDQILEVNGQNVRESNQKDVASIINSLDGEIVLLLGRSTSLSNSIQEWCRKRSQIHWRTRTSTWSAYGGNNKEKVQNQRPSLPIRKETPYFSASGLDKDSAPSSPFGQLFTSKNNWEPEEVAMMSRSSSTRSRSRLSTVVEHSKNHQDSVESEEGENKQGSENPLLPSIQVTEF
ncbi:Eka-INAD2 protein-like protein [Leptotrombidium deliense]|uniref:Eka-INAD2 protein-like protein n=1 Tax=Leptotrombidium deliense TaxID=299467 RepID=A0A443SUP9_9ACAR|nr:Eka-INAD2 protein-like protein [Leptotrombidium deliense]